MALPEAKFEGFWDEPVLINVGFAGLSLKIETLVLLGVSLGAGYTVWGWIYFPVVIPYTNVNLSAICPLACALPFFLSFKAALWNRSFVDLLEEMIGSLLMPQITVEADTELVPVVLDEE